MIYPGTFEGPLDLSNSYEVKLKTQGMGSWDRILIDATWLFEWEPREEWGGLKHPPECRAEPDMVEKILKRWDEYGFSERESKKRREIKDAWNKEDKNHGIQRCKRMDG